MIEAGSPSLAPPHLIKTSQDEVEEDQKFAIDFVETSFLLIFPCASLVLLFEYGLIS